MKCSMYLTALLSIISAFACATAAAQTPDSGDCIRAMSPTHFAHIPAATSSQRIPDSSLSLVRVGESKADCADEAGMLVILSSIHTKASQRGPDQYGADVALFLYLVLYLLTIQVEKTRNGKHERFFHRDTK